MCSSTVISDIFINFFLPFRQRTDNERTKGSVSEKRIGNNEERKNREDVIKLIMMMVRDDDYIERETHRSENFRHVLHSSGEPMVRPRKKRNIMCVFCTINRKRDSWSERDGTNAKLFLHFRG